MHVWHDNRLALLCRHAADSLAQRNTHTRGISLKWTKHQFFALEKIEPGPVHIRQRIEQQRAEVRGVGDEVVLAFEQAQQLDHEARVQRTLRRLWRAVAPLPD